MSIPGVDLRVEIAFDSGYKTPAVDRTWTDVSDYVELIEGLELDYGRPDEISVADANTLSLTLDNTDARFTWGNAASPYYPNVKIGRPIRVTAVVGATEYVRFTGYVNEWPVSWPGGGDTYAAAPLTASSRLSRLGLDSPVVDPLAETVVLADADYYWPLTEAAGATAGAEAQGDSSLSLRVASRPDKVTFGYDDSTAAFGVIDSLPAVKLAANSDAEISNSGRLEASLPSIAFGPGATGAVSFGFFVKDLQPGVATTGEPILFNLFDSTQPEESATALDVSLSPEFQAIATASYPSGGGGLSGKRVSSPIDLATSSELHHVAASLSCDGVNVTLTGYLDGELVGTNTFAAQNFQFTRLRLASPQHNALIGRVMIWRSEVDPVVIGDVANAGLLGFAGDTTDERLLRYTTWASIPSGEVTTTPSAVTLAPIGSADTKALELMRDVEVAEAGVLYDDRVGNLVLKPRSARYATSSALTLDVAAQYVGADFAPKVDRQGLVNYGRGTNSLGTVAVTYSDEASRDDLGDAAYDVETTALDPDEPLQLIAWMVNANSEPRPRAPSVTVNVLDWVGGSISALLALDIGSKVAVVNAPDQAPSSTSDFFVEGYSEQFGEAAWFMTLNLSPAAPTEDVLILDSPTFGVLDANVIAL